MDPIQNIVDKLIEVCGVLNMPIDENRPFDLDEDDLPRISVWTGEEDTVDDGGPAEGWAEEVDISPVIEILLEDDDPSVVSENIKTVWRQLRAELRNTDWTKLTVSGSRVSYNKGMLEIEDKPGVSGFAVTMSFRVELD